MFIGSELITRRGRNITGGDLFAHEPQRRETGLRLLQMLVRHPCGYRNISEYLTTEERSLMAEDVILPLRPAPGQMPQIVAQSIDLQPRRPKELLVRARTTVRGEWIDLGFGAPSEAPF
jgi:hypothetical protein